MNNKPRKWWISGLLSLLHPGLGQIYNGQARKGIIILFLGNLLLPFFFLHALSLYLESLSLLVLYLTVIIILIFCMGVIIDAIRQSNKLKYEYQLKKYNKPIVYVGVFIAAIAISYLIPSLDIDGKTIKNNYLEAYKIPSGSMEPTLLIGDRILVDRRETARNPTRGTIIIFVYPKDQTKDFVKRVEAVGGDIVELRNKELYVNNKLVKETQVVHQEPEIIPAGQNPRDNFGPITVPDGSFFVMGDNRDRAYDSRFWGFVDKPKIKGTVKQIYWSWDRKNASVRWARISTKVL